MKKLKHITKVCQEIYEEKGMSAVFDHVNAQIEARNHAYKNVRFKYCPQCDTECPSWFDQCLICGSVTQEKTLWGEVRWDYLDDIITIDAWLTDDDMEEGRVIAEIEADGEIKYKDERAMSDPLAQEVIREAQMQMLYDRVVDRIKLDFEQKDISAVEELLTSVSRENLVGYLSEEDQKHFLNS